MSIWFLTAVSVVGLIAFLRNTALVRRFLPGRDVASEPGRFERFWSRRDGRFLAVGWLVLLALAIGDFGMVWSGEWQPVTDAFGVIQQVAAAALVPATAGLYVYKRAIPQIARDNADERERAIQGDVYRRAHTIAIGALAIGVALLVVNPAIDSALSLRLESYGVELIDILLPTFLLLFMLPSVAYAWMNPHRDDGTPDDGAPDDGAPEAPRVSRLPAWLARSAAR